MPSRPTPSSLLPLLLGLAACGAEPVPAQPTTPEPAAGWQSELQQGHPLVGRILNPRAGRQLAEDQLYDALAQAEAVVLGEQHDNPDHHELQGRVIRGMVRKGRRPPVVFEHIHFSQQQALDQQLAAHPDDVDGVGRALDWEGSGWPPWSHYRPIFEAAMAYGARLRAGSLDQPTTMALSRQGLSVLDPALVATYGLSAALDATTLESLRKEMRDSHCGMLPESMLDPMVTVQRARDASMAAAVKACGPAGALLIAGNGHARTDRGVPHYLQEAHGTRVLSLAFLEVRPELRTLKDYAAAYDRPVVPFDYVWFTPMVSNEDHCEKLRARFGGNH